MSQENGSKENFNILIEDLDTISDQKSTAKWGKMQTGLLKCRRYIVTIIVVILVIVMVAIAYIGNALTQNYMNQFNFQRSHMHMVIKSSTNVESQKTTSIAETTHDYFFS